MEIAHSDLEKWSLNSISLARKLDLDEKILFHLENKTELFLTYDFPPEGMWFGYCYYNPIYPGIEVFYKNPSTEGISVMNAELEKKKIPFNLIKKANAFYKKFGLASFFEIHNQSGMDHELIGHLYNQSAGMKHDEFAAVKTQISFARERGLENSMWRSSLEFLPEILMRHKELI